MQASLFDYVPPAILGDRDGITFDRARDGKRLNQQSMDVYRLMRDGQWRTLTQIAAATCHPEPSVSARLRDLRKVGYTVERKHIARGLWSYRVTA